ncbi:uncharacterized protein LOC132126230 [Carassius carassius]|uniref:uncharacterized protein LOC132126230 n=1 Tax=Carassius carassius TaxID=217509 RepID=UPI002869479D|nr:uncharacterized protein LOC132126230 [Carassius carassius]
MKLFIFIVIQLLMEVQSYKFPRVKVSPDVIRESSSVKISCETDPRVTVTECHFFINREEKKMKSSSSCELDLTGAEVFRWAAVKSPESLNIICFYTMITEGGSIISSSDSDPATVMVRVSTSTITEQTTTTDMKTSLTVMSTSETTTYSKTDLQTKINLPTSTAKENRNVHPLFLNGSWLSVVLVFTGIGLFLSGLIGFVCLCRFTSSADVLTEVNYVSCQMETTSLLTSSLCSSKHG